MNYPRFKGDHNDDSVSRSVAFGDLDYDEREHLLDLINGSGIKVTRVDHQ
jgi:hypothetical protein